MSRRESSVPLASQRGWIMPATSGVYENSDVAGTWPDCPDADARYFCAAAKILSLPLRRFTSQFVAAIKSLGVWEGMVAIYPMVGGNAVSHAINLKNPDLYPITFFGGTHDSLGWRSAGLFGTTTIDPSTALTAGDWHLSAYSRTTGNTANAYSMGSTNAGGTAFCYLKCRDDSTSPRSQIAGTTVAAGATPTDGSGLFVGTRQSSTALVHTRNGVQLGTTNTTSDTAALPSDTIYLGCRNLGGSANGASNRTYCLFTIGSGMTLNQIVGFYAAAQEFQINLERQV